MKRILFLLISICSVALGHAQVFNFDLSGEYQEGYYIDPQKQIHHGLIKFISGNDFIKFKTGKKEKPREFTSSDIAGFVVGKDSFTVVRDFEVPFGLGGAHIDIAFAKVIKTGIVTLYFSSTFVNGGPNMAGSGNFSAIIDSYLLQREADDPLVRVPDNPAKFKKRLSEYFSDHAVVNEKIKKGTLAYEHITRIVEMYNQEHKGTPLAVQSENGF